MAGFRLPSRVAAMSDAANRVGDREVSVGLWERPHVLFLAIAYGFSWALWIVAWLISNAADAGDVLLNENFLWQVAFVGDVPAESRPAKQANQSLSWHACGSGC